jgi:hypothetical protein
MARITISYRRDDSGAITGRIFDRLVAHYGRDSVFRDIDNIPLGVDFREHINSLLAQSDIVLAIVGPRWIGQRRGANRLENEADPVRLEIEAVLRLGVPLIPVLVQGATMPQVGQLPQSIRDFAYRNGMQIDVGQDFDNHLARLTRAMDRLLDTNAAGGSVAPPLDGPGSEIDVLPQAADNLPAPAATSPGAAAASRPIVGATASNEGQHRVGAGMEGLVALIDLAGADGVITQAELNHLIREAKTRGINEADTRAYLSAYAAARSWKLGKARRRAKVAVQTSRLSRAEPQPPHPLPVPRPPRAPDRAFRWAAAGLAALVVIAIVVTIERTQRQPQPPPVAPTAATAATPASPPAPDPTEREQRAYNAARGNLAALKSYVNGCTVCAFQTPARNEISRLEAAQQEEQTYNAARGNLAALRTYVNGCTVCAFQIAARDEISKLETTEQEERAYNASHGNLAALRTYVNGCTVCAFQIAARDEISKLETTEQEERAYNASRGNKYALQAYVNTCTVCAYASAARAEIVALDAAQPKRVSSSAMICGRSVDYVVDATGVSDPYRSFLGVWTGAAWNSRICGGLIVQGADNDGTARITYVYGPLPGSQFPWKQQSPNAQIRNGQLTFQDDDGGNFAFRLNEQHVLNGHFTSARGVALDAVLTRDMSSVPQ